MSDQGIRKTPDARFAHLGELHLVDIERLISKHGYVDPQTLAEGLQKHGERPLPEIVRDYLCKHLLGKTAAPVGRNPMEQGKRILRRTLIGGLYRRYLRALTKRKELYGNPAGWTQLTCTPGEISARIVAKRFLGGEESWRTVQNIASARK